MTRVTAVNSLGWCIEMFTVKGGWKCVSQVFDTKEAADKFYNTIKFKDGCYRVYEALEIKEQA